MGQETHSIQIPYQGNIENIVIEQGATALQIIPTSDFSAATIPLVLKLVKKFEPQGFPIHFVVNSFVEDSIMYLKYELQTHHLFGKLVFICEPSTENWAIDKRFNCITFFGELGLKRNTRDMALRQYYSGCSYALLAQHEGLNTSTWEKETKNFNLKKGIPSYRKTSPFAKLTTDIRSKFMALTRILKTKFSSPSNTKFPIADVKPISVAKKDPRTWNTVIITGWYGTETTGDKAILGEIIHQLFSYNDKMKILITSIDYRVSWQTRLEMGLQQVEFIPINDDYTDIATFQNADAIIMGGGPLMESSQIVKINKMYRTAAQNGLATVVWGCGVGPIHTDQMKSLIVEILNLSTSCILRDQESYDYAKSIGMKSDAIIGCDPGLMYVHRWHENYKQTVESKVEPQGLLTFLRQQTSEYSDTPDDQNNILISSISKLINHSDTIEKVRMGAMHMYWRGNDDRQWNYGLFQNIQTKDGRVYYDYKTLQHVLVDIIEADCVLAMRFHAHIFSIGLGKKFYSINYTHTNGKIDALLRRLTKNIESKHSKPEEGQETFDFFNAKDYEANIKNMLTDLTNAYHTLWE